MATADRGSGRRAGTAVAALSDCSVTRCAVEQLRRPFKIVAFDWDGTAVMSRTEDAAAVRLRLERLLRLGVFVVIITGTNFRNVDRQASAEITGPFKERLYVCTNRGSEVFGFDACSRPVPLWKRIGTPEENQRLTEIADTVRDVVVRRTGLDVRVIYNRLNRRKIDLIPVPQWANPPKSDIGALLDAVDHRLITGGIPGGLREVFALAVKVARESGLPRARITSDVKHVEVGLTDKGDSIEWMMRAVAAPHGISPEDVLIVGDEFGPIGGFEGSDARMMVPSAGRACFASVGPEPSGVPPSVVHLGGGPSCFRSLLDEQIALRGPDPAWVLVEEGYEPAREREIESLFTVANGYLGTRGSVHEYSALARPATFVAGVFTKLSDAIPELVIAPDWAEFRIFVDREELSAGQSTTLYYQRRLDMRRGVLEHVWRCRDRAGRVSHLHFRRFVSLADRHVLAESLRLTPENHSSHLVVESVVDGRQTNAAITAIVEPSGAAPLLVAEHADGIALAMAVASLPGDFDRRRPERTLQRGERWLAERWEWEAEIGRTYQIDKLVALYTARDGADPRRLAAEHLSRLTGSGVDALLDAHVAAWARRWESADVEIAGDDDAQRAIRFAAYHLISSANPEDERVSVGARALTGESYKGHVFWDTEIYMVPFFVFTHPPAARALLMYRYHTLPAARRRARAMGYRGALYPWESTGTGEDATPSLALIPGGEAIRVLTAEQEHHISADVAYAVWQYWLATGDDRFFLEAGAEIVLETARFWASRVTSGQDGRYHIQKVIGPDEYHEGVDDNAYTNGMARWNLERGAEAARILQERWPGCWAELGERLDVGDDELNEWLAIARKMYTGFNPGTGLFEQFRGYFALDNLDLATYEPRTAPIEVILGRERVARTQIIKQPDVTLLIYLLWDHFPAEVREANFRYYAPRCAHGSSLSPSIHALVAARLGDQAQASRSFGQAAEIDLANNMGNAAGGVHVAAQGGLWQAVVCGNAGMRRCDDGLAFDPHPLQNWQRLDFPVQWRGRRLRVATSSNPLSIEVLLECGDPMVVSLGEAAGIRVVVKVGRRYRAESSDGGWSPWTEAAR